MKEVGLEEFASLPEGTVFSFLCRGDAPGMGGLHRRGEVWRYGEGRPPDFWYADLLPDYRDPAPDSGYELSDAEFRWGMHDPSQRFLVYEPADLALLARMLGLAAPEDRPEVRD